MKLPEITQEILDDFGAGYGKRTQLIDWVGPDSRQHLEPSWTKIAVDFANMIVHGKADDWHKIADERSTEIIRQAKKIAGLEAELEQSREIRGDMSDLILQIQVALGVPTEPHQTYDERMRAEIERMRPDVLRYKWMRDNWAYSDGVIFFDGFELGVLTTLDTAIDTAIDYEAEKP